MFPLFVWLNAFVVIVTPINGLVKDLLDAKSSHLIVILQNVVKNAFPNRVEVILIDLIQHGIDQVFNPVFLDCMQVSWYQLNNM
jgi:hypothetical protein